MVSRLLGQVLDVCFMKLHLTLFRQLSLQLRQEAAEVMRHRIGVSRVKTL